MPVHRVHLCTLTVQWARQLEENATSMPSSWRRRLLKPLCVQSSERENSLFKRTHKLLSCSAPAQQPYVLMGPRAKRETFQLQSCSCESLITARTGERPWVYIHAACFRNWAPNKGRKTEWVSKWTKMTERNKQKNRVSPPFGECSDGKETRKEYHSGPTHPAQHPVTVHGYFPLPFADIKCCRTEIKSSVQAGNTWEFLVKCFCWEIKMEQLVKN